MDSQVTELLGRNWLVSELLRAGLEVAMPIRDRGVDLIAYADLGQELRTFVARPIQMKAATARVFSLDEKYAKFPNLLLAYVWDLADPKQTTSYCLTYLEAFGVAQQMGWTVTPSWVERRSYANSQPGVKLTSLLEPYRMTPELWKPKVLSPTA